jgi:hypothetical protein
MKSKVAKVAFKKKLLSISTFPLFSPSFCMFPPHLFFLIGTSNLLTNLLVLLGFFNKAFTW